MVLISAIILTKNEEKNIARCLNSVGPIADEIIIVDSGSTDKTLDIAREYTKKIFVNPWQNDFASQRNYALQKTTGEWVLSIDADEELPAELAEEIKQFLASNKSRDYAGMRVPRKNIIFGKWLRHGESWPDLQLRLFRSGNYYRRAVHEVLDLQGQVGLFKNPILHYPYENTKQFIARADRYTEIEAEVLIKEKPNPHFWEMLAYPLAKFINVYFIKMGFLDGIRGLLFCGLLGYYSFQKRYKYWLKAHA